MADLVKDLLKALDSLGKSSRYCTSGGFAPVLPGLDVDGVGQIGIPVTQADAKRLIKNASEAPYGRGEETIVDPSVRRVWQIEPNRFTLRNPAWEPFLTGIVDAVKADFAIDRKVDAELYKLLIYRKGSFFVPHRDTEKTSGMFATLVVCLPSRHEGGTLIVEHDGKSTSVDFANAEFEIRYAAFYADCRHEVKPVTKGYRICLVYNLAIAKRRKQPSAPRSGPVVDRVENLLSGLFADEARNKIVIPLDHQYTEAGFDPSELKGADRSRVSILRCAYQTSRCSERRTTSTFSPISRLFTE